MLKMAVWPSLLTVSVLGDLSHLRQELQMRPHKHKVVSSELQGQVWVSAWLGSLRKAWR